MPSYPVCICCLVLLVGLVGWIWLTPREPERLYTLRMRLKPLHPVVSKLRFYESNEAYTLNKKRVFLCTRDQKGQDYSDNMLTYAAIHEIAHAVDPHFRYGQPVDQHPEEYMNIFKALLTKAHMLGLYDPTQTIDPFYCANK
jgi:hypothetical protein